LGRLNHIDLAVLLFNPMRKPVIGDAKFTT
jgi:hypothetical protein